MTDRALYLMGHATMAMIGVAWGLVTFRLGPLPAALAIAGLAIAAAATIAAFMAPRRHRRVGMRAGAHTASLAVAASTTWVHVVGPVLDAPAFAAGMAQVVLSEATGTVLAIGAPLLLLFAAYGCLDVLLSLPHALRSSRRKQAGSRLYGQARLLARRHLRRRQRRPGLLFGQHGPGARAPLIAWPLEGAALTLAPPRRGKGALIALNLLAPAGRGFPGSTVIVDPRGELWCIAARRRRQLGRRAILLDPFAVVAGHDRGHPGALHLPDTASARYNPLDFIREDDDLAVQDIHVLLDALLTPPPAGAHQNSRHFHDSARAIIAGAIAWVRFTGPENARTLARVHELLSLPPERRESTIEAMRAATGFPAAVLARHAAERQAQVGREEGGSNFTTIANQLAFLDFPELARHTANSSFDPAMLARGDTDLFVVAPDDLVDRVRAWLRLWIAIPNAIAARHPLARDLTIVVDEMPRLGYLQPMMDAYTMAAGKGVHFWGFAQSLSALDATWGKEARRTLIDLAEVVQILGWPRADAEGADALSKAIGTATYESLTETSSGTLAAASLTDAATRTQAGDSRALVRERLVTPDDLMTLAPDRQYLVAASRDMPRDAVALHHARYWSRPDTRDLADPNPFVIRKQNAAGHETDGSLEGRTP